MKYKINLIGEIDLEPIEEAIQPPEPTPPGVLMNVNGDFETGDFTGWRVNKSGSNSSTIAEVVTNQKYAGQYSAHLRTTEDYRSEVICQRPDDNGEISFYFDKEYLVKGSLRMNDYAINPSGWTTLVQMHGVPHIKSDGKPDWNCCAGRNLFTIRSTGSSFGVYTESVQDIEIITGCAASAGYMWEKPISQYDNQWIDYEFHFIPSIGASGMMKVKINGAEVISFTGPNTYRLDSCGQPKDQRFYLQSGIYKDKSEPHITRDLNIDEIEVYEI